MSSSLPPGCPATAKKENPSPVQETYRVSSAGTLIEVLREKSCRSRTATKRLLATGRVSVDGIVTTTATLLLSPGQKITVHEGVPPSELTHEVIEIVWEDSDYIVVYKKAGLPTVNTGHRKKEDTVIWIVSQHLKLTDPKAKLFMITRQDNNTEGYVLFAKNIDAKTDMISRWQQCICDQIYVLCVEGKLASTSGEIISETKPDDKQQHRRVRTSYKVLRRSKNGNMAVIEVSVSGARIYNLRKVMKDNDLKIYGDIRSRSSFKTEGKIALLQTQFSFRHPKTGQRMDFKRGFPSHFFTLLRDDKKTE